MNTYLNRLCLGILPPKIPQFNCYQMKMHCTFCACAFAFISLSFSLLVSHTFALFLMLSFILSLSFSLPLFSWLLIAISISFRALCRQPYQRLGQHLISQHTIDNNCELFYLFFSLSFPFSRFHLFHYSRFALWLINVGLCVWLSLT